MFVQPAPGRVVIRPDTQRPLAAAGETVSDADLFWQRRLRDGDVILAAPGAPPPPVVPPMGAMRSASGLVSTRATGANVSGHRALMFTSGGAVVHADPNDPAYAFAGISVQASAAGTFVMIVEAGSLTEPTWSWTPRAPIFVGADGALITAPPASGVLQQVAVAVTPTAIFVRNSLPITRN